MAWILIDRWRTTALVVAVLGCGPGAPGGAETDAGTGAAASTTSAGDASLSASGGADPTSATSADDTGAPAACPAGEYCFERLDLQGLGLPVAADFDGDGVRTLTAWMEDERVLVGWDGVAPTIEATGVEGGGLVARIAAAGGEELVDLPILTRFRLVDGAFASTREAATDLSDAAKELVLAIDVDRDGVDEVIVSDYADRPQGLHVLRRTSEGLWETLGDLLSLAPPPCGPDVGVASDLDGDGWPELVMFEDVANLGPAAPCDQTYDPARDHAVALRSAGDGGFVELWRAPAGVIADGMTLHDLDADTVLDLLVWGSGGVAVARGHGDGTFEDPALLDLAPYEPYVPPTELGAIGQGNPIAKLAVGNLGGDAMAELALVVGVAGSFLDPHDVVLVEDPLGAGIVHEIALESANGSGSISAFDLNHDGIDDLVFDARAGSGSYSLVVMLATD